MSHARKIAPPADVAAWRWVVLAAKPAAAKPWLRWLRLTLGVRPLIVPDLTAAVAGEPAAVVVCVADPAAATGDLPAWAGGVPLVWLYDAEGVGGRAGGAVLDVPYAADEALPPEEWHDRLRDRMRLAERLARLHRTEEAAFEYEFPTDPALVPAAVDLVERRLRQHVRGHAAAVRKVCMATEEALFNALSHGNLEIGSDIRQVDERDYHRLIHARCAEPPYCDRRIRLGCRIAPGRVEVTVDDDGPGFDPAKVPDPTTPERLEAVGGRGLLLIRKLMDEVRFNARGNRIMLLKRLGG